MGNDLTRDAALKGLTKITLNKIQYDASGGKPGPKIPFANLAAFLPSFYGLLKNTHRPLHLYTLEAMAAVTERYPEQFQSHVPKVATEITAMVSAEDLQKASLALKVANNLIGISATPQSYT